MWYISISLSNIIQLVVPILISLIEGCCQQKSYWTKGLYWLSWSNHFESFTVANITCLTVTDNLYHKWPRIYSVCRNHNPVLSSSVPYHQVCLKSNTTGAFRSTRGHPRCSIGLTSYTLQIPRWTTPIWLISRWTTSNVQIPRLTTLLYIY